MELRLTHIYELSIEDEGDYIFVPSGLVIIYENLRFTVYCQNARHNVIRAALSRFAWQDLELGQSYRGSIFRLREITNDLAQYGWKDTSSIPQILRHCYDLNRRHLYFLERYLESSSVTNTRDSLE
jgi:hypothetical protein